MPFLDRRSFVSGAAALALAPAGRGGSAHAATPGADAPVPFSRDWLLGEAERLARQPYKEPDSPLPEPLAEIGYDQYRDLRYRPEARLFAGSGRPFAVDLFHRGFLYTAPVTVWVVEKGSARRIRYRPEMFEFGSVPPPPPEADIDFSGLRVRHPINVPDVWDEFLVFQGASYFRAVARDQAYGLSARGLAINTAHTEGEEFPHFTAFWIETPEPRATSLVVHALLDSPSATGAYRFAVQPGAETVIDVEAVLFPRVEIDRVGLAPASSMFLFDASNRYGFEDFRPAVHDSNGLQMLTGAGEWLWRPLANPAELQVSAFVDRSPRAFGLMQRARRFDDFQDLEARYERRPSLWIEPLEDWGEGAIHLVEIPAEMEIHDNIAAFWRPAAPLPAAAPWRFAYRMRWVDAIAHDRLAVVATRAGRTIDKKRLLFVVDFAAAELPPIEEVTVEVSASAGKPVNPVLQANRPAGTLRASFEIDTDGAGMSELQMRLLRGGRPASETWLYRWTDR